MVVLTERKMKERERERERETEKESATLANSRSLLGRGDLRGTLAIRAALMDGPLLQAGVLSILWWERDVGGGWALEKMTVKGDGGCYY
jgi:hypothetical protein